VKSEIYPQITLISADFFPLLARAKGRAPRRGQKQPSNLRESA
jgi:hypothetical protein